MVYLSFYNTRLHNEHTSTRDSFENACGNVPFEDNRVRDLYLMVKNRTHGASPRAPVVVISLGSEHGPAVEHHSLKIQCEC